MSVNITALTIIVFLLPMFYFLLASPAFLLVRLDIPQVARLLRAMFYGYFLALVVVGVCAATLNALVGRPFQSLVIGLVTAFVFVWRHWMMLRVDALVAQVQSGLNGTAPRLRRLHWLGMGANALQTALMLVLIPSFVVVA